jgi:hypothetical protein
MDFPALACLKQQSDKDSKANPFIAFPAAAPTHVSLKLNVAALFVLAKEQNSDSVFALKAFAKAHPAHCSVSLAASQEAARILSRGLLVFDS